MKGNTQTLLLLALAGGAALWFFTKNGGAAKRAASADGGMSAQEAAFKIEQEKTEQKKLELDYMKQAGERDWEDVALDFAGGFAKAGGTALGSAMGGLF